MTNKSENRAPVATGDAARNDDLADRGSSFQCNPFQEQVRADLRKTAGCWVIFIPSPTPQFLAAIDFEANGPNYPTGMGTGTFDPEKALKFESFEAAYEFLMTTSKSCPVRPDGKPNRPLCALRFLEIVEISDLNEGATQGGRP